MQVSSPLYVSGPSFFPARQVSYLSPAPAQTSWRPDSYVSSLTLNDAPIPKEPLPPYAEPPAPGKGELGTMLRLGGLLAGGAAIGGTAGFLAGKAFGFSTTAGAAVGAGLGFVAPIGMLIYALKTWN